MSPLASARRASMQSKPVHVVNPAAAEMAAAVVMVAEAERQGSRRGSARSTRDTWTPEDALEADEDEDDDDDDDDDMSPISSTNSVLPTAQDGGGGAGESSRRASSLLEADTIEALRFDSSEILSSMAPTVAVAAAASEDGDEEEGVDDGAPASSPAAAPATAAAFLQPTSLPRERSSKKGRSSMHPPSPSPLPSPSASSECAEARRPATLRHDSHTSQKSAHSEESSMLSPRSSSSDARDGPARPALDRGGSACGLAFLRSNQDLQALVEEEEEHETSTSSNNSTTPAVSTRVGSPVPAPADGDQEQAPTMDEEEEEEDAVPINAGFLAKLKQNGSFRRG